MRIPSPPPLTLINISRFDDVNVRLDALERKIFSPVSAEEAALLQSHTSLSLSDIEKVLVSHCGTF